MIVNEKALVKAMEKAAASGGYRVRVNEEEGTLVICTQGWLVQMKTALAPRKVLGVLAEHFGFVPEDGCFTVFKQKNAENATVQSYQSEVFSMDVMHLCYGDGELAGFLPASAWGWIFAENEEGILYAAKPDDLTLALAARLETVEGKSLRWVDDDSAVFVEAVTKDAFEEPKRSIVEALEKIDWNIDMTPPAPPEAEDDGQMEIGDAAETDDAEEGDET